MRRGRGQNFHGAAVEGIVRVLGNEVVVRLVTDLDEAVLEVVRVGLRTIRGQIAVLIVRVVPGGYAAFLG